MMLLTLPRESNLNVTFYTKKKKITIPVKSE